MLAEANRFYWGHNLLLAAPLYNRAQVLFSQARDPRDALYAQIGLMRTQDQTSFPDISAFIATQLTTSLVQNDPFLRLWCIGVKGDADMETNVGAAEEDWQQVMKLATSLGQTERANRARGELGIVDFLRGDYRTAVGMIGSGGMARTYLDAFCQVRKIKMVKVFSPNRKHVEDYAEEVSKRHGIKVEQSPSAREAVRGVDIVSICTSTNEPVFENEWLEPGMHVTNLTSADVKPDLPQVVDVAVRAGEATPRLANQAYCRCNRSSKSRVKPSWSNSPAW